MPDHKDWDWRRDYERQFGALPSTPPEPDDGGENLDRPPQAAAPDSYRIHIPAVLTARLMPYADKRSITLERLVLDLLEVELEGGLIDLTLDGENIPPTMASELAEAYIDGDASR